MKEKLTIQELQDKAEAALKKAVREFVQRHKKQAARLPYGRTVKLFVSLQMPLSS